MSTARLITFLLSGERLALKVEEVGRVVPVPRVDRAPGAPAFIDGYFSLHGAPVPVVRLDRLLGLPEARLGVYAPLILLAAGTPPVALYVQSILSVDAVAEADIRPIAGRETLNGCVSGQVSNGGGQAYLLVASRLLLERERQSLAAHQAMIERRLAAVEDRHAR